MSEDDTVHLTIDGHAISVAKGTTVYTAARQLGIDVPIFCYHDRMPPFGACRVCLVEVEKIGKPQTSCTLEAKEGMVVKTQSAMATQGREQILEFLLLNHPLDCPICDKGGECPLQDQTLKFGPGQSRFFEEKRHFKKPLSLGPVLKLDRERCIACARCTRFGEIVAGDHALELLDRGYKIEVGTPDGGPAESKFIGNTIMICPVGALTSEVYRFRARPWDNTQTLSTCTLCPVGCSMILDSRDGEVMRTRSCENREVNDIWLCDKGWFGYEFVDHPERLHEPLIRRNGELIPTSWEEALSVVAAKIQEAKPTGKLAALGGNALTIEENYLFQKLMREGAGVNHIDHRIGTPIFSLNEEGAAPGMEMSIGACENLECALILGLDITEEFPVVWLRLKQAINRGAEVLFLGHFTPEIAQDLTQTILHAPGDELEALKEHLPRFKALAEQAKTGAIFVGKQYLSTPHRHEILSELAKMRQSMPKLTLNIMEGRGNSVGARLAGMRPDLGPLNTPLANPGLNAIQILEAASQNGWDFLYIAGANPTAHFPSKLWNAAREKLGFLVVQDLFLTEAARQADVVLPTLCFVEKQGSFVNIERRMQQLQPGKEVPKYLYSDAEIFTYLAEKLNCTLSVDTDFFEGLAKFQHSSHQIENIQTTKTQENKPLAATFARALFDHGVRMSHDPHVIQLAKEPRVRIHPLEGRLRELHDGDTVSIEADGNSITSKIKFDAGVAKGTAVLPLGFEELPSRELGANLMNGLAVELKICG